MPHRSSLAVAIDGQPIPAPDTRHLRFTGSGKEYFRIWIVNLFLTIATLGVYSAWAKVRRIQYFHRNTHLAGAVFDFDGDPLAILRGRVLAVLLLAGYHYAFGFSLLFGFVVIALLLATLPLMMRGALRFRLRNTRYRGLRFGFDGSPAAAYRAYLPPVLLLLLPTVLTAVGVNRKFALLMLPAYLAWPLMHLAMKRYQYSHLRFGSLGARFQAGAWHFYKPYLTSIGIALAIIVLALVLLAGGLAAAKALDVAAVRKAVNWFPLLFGAIVAYLVYLFSAPYLQVHLGNRIWSSTSFPGVTISSHLPVRAFMKLQVVNTMLTLTTLGLYRPFAQVRIYEFRLAHVDVSSEGGFEAAVAQVSSTATAGASADGVSDFFGVDLSW